MDSSSKLWQVQVNNQIYQADENTLKSWLIEGRIAPTDKIRTFGQDWVEIGKVFYLEGNKQKAAAAQAVETFQINSVPTASHLQSNDIDSRKHTAVDPIFYRAENWKKFLSVGCAYHPEIAPEMICPECGAAFCKNCTEANIVGGSYTKACKCASCGALCRAYQEVKEKLLLLTEQRGNFGWNDVKIALLYPKSLDVASMILFTILMALGAFAFPFFFAVAIIFNSISFTVKDVAIGNRQGAKLDLTSFLTEVTKPLAFGLGAILITFAPILALIVGKLNFLYPLMPVAICWAIFYYPIALLVAGLTESFADIVNVAKGFQVIKHMEIPYYKVLGYCFLIELPILLILMPFAEILSVLFSAGAFIAVPMMIFWGIIFGIPLFYLNISLACLVGRSVFKSADKLGVYTKASTKVS